jgi:glycosyltransferase involved in cell wall biosynthesis
MILVSICCITFNHQDYIEDTIKGVLNQKANFNYELIIGED